MRKNAENDRIVGGFMDRNTELLECVKNGDAAARDALCHENMGLVRKAAQKFSFYGAEFDDLVQTGAIGLLKAIDNFDLSLGVKFSTYAVPMIIGEIRRFLRDDGPIKVSRGIKRTAYHGYAARDELSRKLGREPTLEEIAKCCSVSTEEMAEAFCATAPPDSINREIYSDSARELGDALTEWDSEEQTVNKIAVREILERLEPRERQIIVLRYFKEKTQAEIARVIGVSQVQVSRLEKKVICKIREDEKSFLSKASK